MVSRAEIIDGYRWILGREPENDSVIDQKKNLADREALRANLINSDEFRMSIDLMAVGLHFQAREFQVEVDVTEDQRRTLLDHVVSEWYKLGQEDAHWSVMTAENYRTDKIASNFAAFFDSGAYDVSRAEALLHRNGLSFPTNGTLLDFGCGVGRLSFSLAKHCGKVMGIDISAPHLALAKETARKRGLSNIEFRQIREIADLAEIPPIDGFFSLIVLQHNPPPIIYAILDLIFSRLVGGGSAIFQVPTYIDGYSYVTADYLAKKRKGMEMHALPQRHIYSLFARHGMQLVEVREDDATGSSRFVSQTFLARKL